MNIVAGSRTGIDMKLTGSLLPIFQEMGTPAQSNGQKAAASLGRVD
jgi:hypothetical protein